MTTSFARRFATNAATFAALLLSAHRAGAQITESPVTFDSAGRVPAITQALADRLRLGPPAWPVTGRFDKARLYRSSDGTYVLVVERTGRAIDRYALTEAQATDLRLAVQTPLNAGRRAGIGEQTDVASEPAGNAFVRNQATLGWLLYGPTAAGAFASDGASASATELLVAGGTFFAAMARRQTEPVITTAQNNLSTVAALNGGALGGAIAYIVGVNDGRTASGAVLLGSLAGTVAGLRIGAGMTDAEAAASSFGADALAGTAVGVMASTGVIDWHHGNGKGQVAAASAAMIAGYALGPSYPRRARYTVTAGDVRSVTFSSWLGIAAAATPLVGSDHDDKTWAAALTTGFIGGTLIGDRLLAKPYDHTRSESTLLFGGMVAGALVGGGVSAAASAPNQMSFALGTGGAIIGAVATEAFLRSSPRSVALRGPIQTEGGERRVGVSLNPMGLAFAAGRRPGRFSIVRVTF